MDEKKATQLKDSNRPKEKVDWNPGGCPFLFFGDEKAAEYDMTKLKNFFSRFKKKGINK